MQETAQNLQVNSRSLARLISNSGFSKLTSAVGARNYGMQLRNLIVKGGVELPEKCTLQYLLDVSYFHLQQTYRHEYVYKTKLLSDFILKKYSLSDSIILNEFRIGKSVADMVLVNGTNKVFEIKTELDNPDRLKTQISDYYKAFSEVYIVTHHSLASKYKAIVDPCIGIIEFHHDYSLNTSREAIIDNSRLENITMMKSLRKGEFLNIVKKENGVLPVVTPVKLFKACLDLVSTIEPVQLQRHFLEAIKSRIAPEHEFILKHKLPDYLKFFCYLVNFTEKQYLALPERLSCLV